MAGDAILRPAGPDDLPGLLALYAELNPDDPPMDAATAEARFTAILAQPGMTIYVAVKDGIPLASCTLVVVPNLTRSGAPYALIENVVTDAGHRNRGLGKAILKAALDRACAAGCYKAMLMTGSRKPSTLAFYEAAGFEQSKTGFQARRLPARAE